MPFDTRSCAPTCTEDDFPATTDSVASVQSQIPYAFAATGLTSTDLGCSTGSVGYGAIVAYQVVDRNGNQIKRSGMTPQELVTVSDDRGNVISAGTQYRSFSTPVSTTSNGTFTDKPVGSCLSPPPSSNVCFNVTQLFNLVVGNTTFDIHTITIRRDCVQGIRVSVQNGIDNVQVYELGTVN
jgi:hypothetical protein